MHIQDAILLDAELDDLSIEELQELVEFLAKYYPHKLNLTRLNLTLLDLKRIDLTQVNLKGVDFTGCNFFGVNIYELDLSECIISIAQIEQAIGHTPTALELKKILAPKNRKNKPKLKGIDLSAFFEGRGSLTWDATKGGIDMATLLKNGKAFIKSFQKEDSDEKIIEKFGKKHKDNENINEEEKNNNIAELRKTIEQHKKEVLERRQEEQNNNEEKERERENMREKIKENRAIIIKSIKNRER